MADTPKTISDDPHAAAALIRRLLREQGAAYWRRYAVAAVLMTTAAGVTAALPWLLGEVINKAYIDRNVGAIVSLSLLIMALFVVKGATTYGQAVILTQISNAIVAHNQRSLFA
jgi:ATP-binding cassette subfamily B protein